MPDRLFFQRRDRNGTSTHHLHVVPGGHLGDPQRAAAPRASPRAPEQARRYGELKLRLARPWSGEADTRAKTALIQELVDAARDALGLPRVPVWEE